MPRHLHDSGRRSKNGRAHTLPLLPMALAIIKAVPRMATRPQLFGRHGHGYVSFSQRQGGARRTSWRGG